MAHASAVAAGVPVAVSVPTDAEIERRFLELLPELESRANAISRAVSRSKVEREEAAAEVIAQSWRNYRQAASKGRWLTAGQMSWFCWHSVRSGRTLAGLSSQNDVLDRRAAMAGHVKVLHLGSLMRGQHRRGKVHRRRTDPTDLSDTERLVRALTTSEKESPLEVARQRIDWRAFADGQDRRTRVILAGIAEGRMGKEVAKKLRITPGRLCQVMDAHVRPEVAEFFELCPVTGRDIHP